MTLDVLADVIAIFAGHDHIGNHHVRPGLLDLAQSGGGIVMGHHVDVLAPEGDLNDFAHGRAVINEINCGDSAHQKPPSGPSCASSSSSRSASSINSVAERRTVRVEAVSPGTNLYPPLSTPLLDFTICTTASSPIRSPHSA